MSQVYVNEKTGVDSTESKGTEASPYQTPVYALFVQTDAKVFVYKQVEDSEEFAYAKISASALKKAKKGAEGIKKKAEKQAILEEQQKKKDAENAQKFAE